tara:strand:- start:456 stop:713 length:258 start_codon:yes stop_codon:yes gene_type:complete
MVIGNYMEKPYQTIINMPHQRLMWLRNRIKKKMGYEQGSDNHEWKTNIDLQWVDIQLEEIGEGVVLGKGTMLRANDLWKKYGKDN